MTPCQHIHCTAEGRWGIDIPTCYKHKLTCLACEQPASSFSTAGQLCAAHSDQAYAIEKVGTYPSPNAIRTVIENCQVSA